MCSRLTKFNSDIEAGSSSVSSGEVSAVVIEVRSEPEASTVSSRGHLEALIERISVVLTSRWRKNGRSPRFIVSRKPVLPGDNLHVVL